MKVKNGIIIDGILHEAILDSELVCEDCSMYSECYAVTGEICAIFNHDGFISRGEVNIEKEEANNE